MTYLLKVLRDDEEIVSLLVEADSEAGAEQVARTRGYAVLDIRRRVEIAGIRLGPKARFSPLLFSQELLALLAAGLSLVEALHALTTKRRYAGDGIVEGLAKALTDGRSFSAAIAGYPQYFSPLHIATVEASERTGSLQEALRRYVDYQEQMDRMRKKVVSACMYPALLALVGMLVVLFLLFYVVPRFSKVYESFSGDLPFFSRLLIGVGRLIGDNGWFIGLALATGVLGAVVAIRTPSVRKRLSVFLATIPAVAENLLLYEITRLYRTLGMLLKAGVPVTQAMLMVKPLLDAASRPDLERAHRAISDGQSISAAMTQAGLVTPIGERMLLVGEKTGNMGSMMERLAQFHEEDLARWIENFAKLFEPLLMLALGLMVGAIVVLMYMPIFELATVIQS